VTNAGEFLTEEVLGSPWPLQPTTLEQLLFETS